MHSRFEQDQYNTAIAAQKEKTLATYKAWIQTKPHLYDCEANEEMFRSYMDFTDDLTPADFDFALGNLSSRLATQYVVTPEEIKADLIEQILSLIASSNGGRDGKYDAHSLRLEKEKMSHWSIPQLNERLAEITRKQTLATKSVGELNQILVSARKYQGYPQLGQSTVRPGTVRAVPLNAEYLRSLDAWELKKFCRLYGVEQVNARLRGE